jgi:hypothetical protein
MTALIFAPPPRHFYAFPLVIQWRARYEALEFYFPHLQFGLLEAQPKNRNFTSLLQPPRQKDVQTLKRDYHPGELKQWQAYLDYLAVQEDQDETDLQAAIRGRLEPVLPKEADRELLWSLAYQLEQMLSEEAAGLQRLADQQKALKKTLGDDLSEESDLEILQATLTPSLLDSQPDPALARVRYQFWRQVLAPHLNTSWAALVLEPDAGASSPRYLWETGADEDQSLWRAGFDLPDWRLQPDHDPQEVQALQLGVEFQKIFGDLLQALTDNPAEVEICRQKMLRLAEERLWPLSGIPQAQSIHLEVFGWLKGAIQAALIPGPMIFLSPAG